ncbi:MAG: hypothetical protein JNJ73_02805 [Hyphomonadaceae bacterium]|nr:hypothetical protein [Hyphomonadaceae bacterium]
MTNATRITTCIVDIDWRDSTPLIGCDPAKAARLVTSLRKRLNKLAESVAGRCFITTGDGAMLELPSATSAIEAALALQDQAYADLPLRCGADAGDVERLANGDLIGAAASNAARLQKLSPVGGALISRTLIDLAPEGLKAKFVPYGFASLGQGKNIETFALLPGSQGAISLADFTDPEFLEVVRRGARDLLDSERRLDVLREMKRLRFAFTAFAQRQVEWSECDRLELALEIAANLSGHRAQVADDHGWNDMLLDDVRLGFSKVGSCILILACTPIEAPRTAQLLHDAWEAYWNAFWVDWRNSHDREEQALRLSQRVRKTLRLGSELVKRFLAYADAMDRCGDRDAAFVARLTSDQLEKNWENIQRDLADLESVASGQHLAFSHGIAAGFEVLLGLVHRALRFAPVEVDDGPRRRRAA